jgi:hypothetical protein
VVAAGKTPRQLHERGVTIESPPSRLLTGS